MKLGDHVHALVNGEHRHGIDCGDRTVLFLGRDASGRPEVRRALLADFAAGAGRVETVVHREPVLAPRVVVARAFSRLRDPAAAAAFTSSEDYAAWCLTGRAPEPGYAAPPAQSPAPAARKAGRVAGKKRAEPARRAAGGKAKTGRGKPARGTARKAVPRRKAGRAAPRRAAARGKAPA
ncbi:MAG TPA: hypothetical protein VIW03_06340, partial [Anaeromyxobacter sp.]